MERILTELNDEGRTIIMVTHSQEAAEIAKREVFIKDGEIYSDKSVRNRRLQPKEIKETLKEKEAKSWPWSWKTPS